jgi:hypothetical protein
MRLRREIVCGFGRGFDRPARSFPAPLRYAKEKSEIADKLDGMKESPRLIDGLPPGEPRTSMCRPPLRSGDKRHANSPKK